jgi:hypothetical protein
MEDSEWLVAVCYVPGAVSGPTSFAGCWLPSLIFNPSFAKNDQPRMTPQI